jgi:hypothetical protein
LKRETRLNLWFLGIFLVVSLPGAVILFIKKLDPGASRMDTPDAVLAQLPYMAPTPAPPETRWMVPPKTRQWLADLTQQNTGGPMASAVAEGPEWEPVISSDHLLQLMSHRRIRPKTEAYSLLLWGERMPANAAQMAVRLSAPAKDEVFEGTVKSAHATAIPADVRKELVQLGFDHPPMRVLWIEIESDHHDLGPWQRITLQSTAPQTAFTDSVNFRDDDLRTAPSSHPE